MTDLSVVIVNYRSWSCLAECLNGLRGEDDTMPFEVVVVDNHSNDGVLAGFERRFQGVTFVDSGFNGGFAFGCNTGAKHASGNTLLFLNPDVLTDQYAVQSLVEAKNANPEISILSASQVDGKGRPQKVFDLFPHRCSWNRTLRRLMRRFGDKGLPDPRSVFSGLVECDWVSGSVLMIDREDFNALGGWSEEFFMYAEDCDLCYRASRKDLLVACTGDVSMVHLHGGATRQNHRMSVITRTEAIISKHVFNQLHCQGFRRAMNHMFIFLASVPELTLYSLMDLLTLRRIKPLRIRTEMLARVIGHYWHVFREGHWRSRRLPAPELLPR